MCTLFSECKSVTLVKYDLGLGTKTEVNTCAVAFVCVPTPQSDTGSCDTSIVEHVLGWLRTPLTILRSTVPPGSLDAWSVRWPHHHLVMNPEYVGETVAHPLNDTTARSFVVLGGSRKDTEAAVHVYENVYNASVRFMQVTAREAEVIKYCENSFIGTYVTFCNEMYNVCKAFDVSWSTVREGFLLDPRMTPYWTLVYPHSRGFGGKCIPKDMNAIVAASQQQGYEAPLLSSVLEINDRFRQQSTDAVVDDAVAAAITAAVAAAADDDDEDAMPPRPPLSPDESN